MSAARTSGAAAMGMVSVYLMYYAIYFIHIYKWVTRRGSIITTILNS